MDRCIDLARVPDAHCKHNSRYTRLYRNRGASSVPLSNPPRVRTRQVQHFVPMQLARQVSVGLVDD